MVFTKRGGLRNNEFWSYSGKKLEALGDFSYLGTVFNYTGSFSLNQETLAGKGLKALNFLINNIKKYSLKPKTICQLFHAFVGSTLNYASEVWCFLSQERLKGCT